MAVENKIIDVAFKRQQNDVQIYVEGEWNGCLYNDDGVARIVIDSFGLTLDEMEIICERFRRYSKRIKDNG